MKMTVLALALITLHGPTGARLDINGDTVASIRDPHAMSEGHWDKHVHCVVIADGSGAIAVRETCDEVRALLHGMLPNKGPCTLVCGEAPAR